VTVTAAAQVHAVIAAALDDSERLQGWLQNPELVRQFGVDPAQIDWQGMWCFAGLTAKVRHNPLRADFPLTFRVLKATGLEVEVFSHYAGEAARLRVGSKTSNEEKVESLYAFLESWLDPADDRHALIWDVISHEITVMRMGRSRARQEERAGENSPTRIATDHAPEVRGELTLRRMNFDPERVAERVLSTFVAGGDLKRDPCLLGYWRCGPQGRLSILRLDSLGFHLLEMADGRTAIGSIGDSMRATGIRVADEELIDAYSSLAGQGLVFFRGGPRDR
jgi:hypothetical protein